MKRKGMGTRTVIRILIAIIVMAVLAPILIGTAEAAGSSTEGCSMFASIISDMTGGKISLC